MRPPTAEMGQVAIVFLGSKANFQIWMGGFQFLEGRYKIFEHKLPNIIEN